MKRYVERLPVRRGAEILAWLRAADESVLRDAALIERLAFWREKNKQHFLSVFSMDCGRTRDWIERDILGRDDRILFLVETNGQRPAGHFGLCGITETSAEFDNVIKGEDVAIRGLFYQVGLTVLHFAFSVLHVDSVYSQVLSQNTHANDFYKRLGMTFVSRMALLRENIGENAYRFRPVPEGETAGSDLFYNKYVIRSDVFYSLHPEASTWEIL